MDDSELEYYETLADNQQKIVEALEKHEENYNNRHDPIEDIVLNDEDEANGYCSYTDYMLMTQEDLYESHMFALAKDIQEEKLYGHIKDMADEYYEQREQFEKEIEEDARRDAMYRLLETMDEAKEFGCEHDKSFAYEGLDILSEERVDEDFGDGDPSQWNY